MFRFRGVSDTTNKTFGFFLRLFGIDFALLLIWSLSDLRIIELKIPCNSGIFFQFGGIVLSVGRFRDDEVYRDESA